MALEDLEKNLYRQKPEQEPEKIPPSVLNLKQTQAAKPEAGLPGAWPKNAPGTESEIIEAAAGKVGRFGKIIFWSLLVAVLILGGIGGFYYYQYSKNSDLSLYLKAPAEVLVGIPFDISVNFTNGSNRTIEDVKLSGTLPEGVVLNDEPDKRFFEEGYGTLAQGAGFETKIPVTVFSNPDSVKKFAITVSYLPPSLGPKVRFDRTESIDLTVREPAVKLDLTAPQKILSNENFEIKLDYKNVSDYKFPNASIELSYPQAFSFKGADPAPTIGNKTWAVDELDKGAGGSIVIRGSILAAEKSFFEFKAKALAPNGLIAEKSASVNIAESPLSFNVTLNNLTDYVARLDDTLRYAVNYKNNSEVGLNDVVVKAKLTGEMFDFTSLHTKGFFSSQNNTILWNTANTPELRMVAPGATGVVEFEINTKRQYPIRRLSDKNFLLKIDADISSPTVPYYVAADKTAAVTRLETKLGGEIAIADKLLFRDPNSDIKNTGPIPPKVNFPTTFNVHWLITNYATDARNVQIKSTLLSGVRFTGKTSSNISTVPSVNERTGEVTWSIDGIPATKGILSKPVEAIFQIEATPNVTQIGQPMPLLGDTTLTATDAFTSSTLTSSLSTLTTLLSDDPTVGEGQGTVTP